MEDLKRWLLENSPSRSEEELLGSLLSLDGFLKRVACAESGNLLGRNPHFLPRLRVPTIPGLLLPTAVATIIDPVDGGRRKSSSSYMFCCEALLSAICTDLLAFCEGVNVFGGSCTRHV